MSRKMSFNKIGILIGFAIAVLLVSYQMYLYPMPAQKRIDMLLSVGGLLMTLGVIFGGTISGFIIENYLRTRFTKKGGIWGGIIVSILISPYALAIGIAFGTVGVGYGELLGNLIGMRQFGIYAGLFVAIVIVIILVECAGAGIGAVLGSFIQSIVQRLFHHPKK